MTTQVAAQDFFRVEMRVGRIQKAEVLEKTRVAAFKLWIDFGPDGVRKSSAQLTARYEPQDLEGRLVVAVTNLPPRQVADFVSEVLVLGAVPVPGDVVLLAPDADVPLGSRIA